MNYIKELPSDGYLVPMDEGDPIFQNDKSFIWCVNHKSDGQFHLANRERAMCCYPLYWFELEADAILFKLKFY